MTERARLVCALLLFGVTSPLMAQGGPPMRTDDPGTPGNGNLEMNIAATNERFVGERVLDAPLLDLNYGVGDRIQLKFELPWILERGDGEPAKSGLGNSLVGVKWRFFDDEKRKLFVSVYPQIELNNPTESAERGLVEHGSHLLLPIEAAKELGPIAINAEAGIGANRHGAKDWLASVAIGHRATERIEIVAELHAFTSIHEPDRQMTLDIGSRAKMMPTMLLLLMGGRTVRTASATEPRFVGYAGLQFLIGKH